MLNSNNADNSELQQLTLTNKEGLFYVTQDGAAILFNNTFPNIKGLYTENLQTCIAVFIFGEKGMALLHCTRKSSLSNIRMISEQLGAIQSAYICHNDHPLYQDGISETKNRIFPAISKQTSNIKYIECTDGYVGVERKSYNSLLCFPLPHPSPFIFPVYVYLRNWINITNNYFLEQEEEMTPDTQFDGGGLKSIPSLNKNHEMIKLQYHNAINRVGIDLASKMLRTHAVLTSTLIGRARLSQGEYAQIGMDAKVIKDINDWLNEQDTHDLSIAEEVEAQLRNETSSFFSGAHQFSWKAYPAKLLTGKYIGHRVMYLTMPLGTDEQADQFCNTIKLKGFDAERRKAGNKPSIVVDLTNAATMTQKIT